MNKLDNYLDKITNLTLDEFPHSLLLTGLYGSGKHTIYNYIIDRFNIDNIDLTDILNTKNSIEINDYIVNDICLKVFPCFYLIDFTRLSGKVEIKENNLLKLIEEPFKNTYIVIICENRNFLLSTVVNRCIEWKMPVYTKQDISTYTLSDIVNNIADTPGMAIAMADVDVSAIYDYCKTIFYKIAVANPANILAISNRIAFNNETDKYNLKIFNIVLHYTIYEMCKVNNGYYNAYILTKELMSNMSILNIDKKNLLENYLFRLKEVLS